MRNPKFWEQKWSHMLLTPLTIFWLAQFAQLTVPTPGSAATLGHARILDGRIGPGDTLPGFPEDQVPALLRLKLGSKPATPWSVVVRTPTKVWTVSSDKLGSFLVDDDVIEVPIDTKGPITFEASSSAPVLDLFSVVSLTREGQVEHTQGHVSVEFLGEGSLVLDGPRSKRAQAVVALKKDDKNGWVYYCSGFQFMPGVFLTNRHCLAAPESALSLVGERVSVRFGVTVANPHGTAGVLATVQDESTVLDYLLLKATDSSPKPADTVLLWYPGFDGILSVNSLELYGFWSGKGVGHKSGLYVCRDSECSMEDAGFDSFDRRCAFPSFKHGCDTEEGSSGSAIFNRGGDRVVGLHHTGLGVNSGNCAVRVWTVVDQIKLNRKWDPSWNASLHP